MIAILKQSKRMDMTICCTCGDFFTPKEKGYNAKYCSKYCKAKAGYLRLKKKSPELIKAYRADSYIRQKKDPVQMEKRRLENRIYVKATRDWLAAYKLSIGCIDCGFKGHFSALQLDHEGEKSVSISEARSSIARLKKEIKDGNCKVRCANCHSIKTWERKQNALLDKPIAI